MDRITGYLVCLTLFLVVCLTVVQLSAGSKINIETPMTPPEWALLEREVLRANTAACRKFFERYFDERGYLQCVTRWGGDDGPDDAIENCNDWTLLHALGAGDVILKMYKTAWEGHLRQYTDAKTVEVPFARDGMYYKEFPVTFDWLHNGEGLSVFNLQGLSDPYDHKLIVRLRRFAGFYMNEDPGAPNYDPKHKIIRSMFNGSRGPLLRKTTGLDWAGDPIDVENRFDLGHGERNYAEMVAHFKDYNDIVGDHPLNLLATTLAMNAYMATGEVKYRRWILEYVDAWQKRMIKNDYIIPTNIGLDGTIGGETNGKWYGGVYGWAHTVVVPQDGSLAHRNIHHKGFVGFMNAYMLSGDDKYLAPWRKQIDRINSNSKVIDGQRMYPRMYGDQGWYHYVPDEYDYNATEIYYLSMDPEDLKRLLPDRKRISREDRFTRYRNKLRYVRELEYFQFLNGLYPDFPEQALRADLERIRSRADAMKNDTTTPDTRLADDPMKYNPASVTALVYLMLGGLHPEYHSSILFCRVRYFDPLAKRAGIPEDVAALVDELTEASAALTLVNMNQVNSRIVTIQAGGYAEHQFTAVSIDGREYKVDDSSFSLRLAPGTGAKLYLQMKRYVNEPTLKFPWDRN